MDVSQIILTLIMTAISIGGAYSVARKFGDVAGAKAAIEYEEGKTATARIAALQTLLNEVTRIRGLAGHNAALSGPKLVAQPVTKMPVTAFETAFLSGQSSLLGRGRDTSDIAELMACVAVYLREAGAINTLVDLYLGLIRGLSSAEERRREIVLNDMAQRSEKMASLVDQLGKHLCQALEVQN